MKIQRERKAANQEQRRELMLNTPISRVIPQMAVPTIIAFLINSIYSMADTYFVTALGTNATAAVSVNASLDQVILMCGSMLAMGANSYIGNAPNFMVRSIAEEQGVAMPSFFGYMAWSVGILFPCFALITYLFFV